jgi:hypothetical protein
MTLNWTPEVLIEFIIGPLIIIASIFMLIVPRTRKIKSILFIQLGFFCGAWVFLFEGLGILFLNPILIILDCLMAIPISISFIIGVNYITTESYYSRGLLLVSFLSGILLILAFQPGAVVYTHEFGYPTINWSGLFNDIGDILTFIAAVYVLYWGIKTYKNAPFSIRKAVNIFFLGVIIFEGTGVAVYALSYLNPIFILFSDIIIAVGIIIISVAIVKEPKILYILPFTVYRIIVKDKEGHPLFGNDWSESDINEKIFSGFLNAVQLMSEEVMNIGGLLDVNLAKGILTLYESDKITVGLVASKSSKLLRASVKNFSIDFENLFKLELEQSIREPSRYNAAYGLIDKHFSNFPIRLPPFPKKPLLVTSQFLGIPLELDNKLKEIFVDEKEYEFIQKEMEKSPFCTPEEFIHLYDELKDQYEDTSEEENSKKEQKSQS